MLKVKLLTINYIFFMMVDMLFLVLYMGCGQGFVRSQVRHRSWANAQDLRQGRKLISQTQCG